MSDACLADSPADSFPVDKIKSLARKATNKLPLRDGITCMNPTVRILAYLLLMGLSPGCSSPDPTDLLAQANNSNIKRLANLYEAYQSRHNWRGPQNEEQFKSFLKSWNPKKLERIGVDPEAIDNLFISGRDHQPFKIRYGVPGHIMGSDEPVIFESAGVDGKFLVGFLNMEQREVSEDEYQQLFESKPARSQTEREAI